MEASLRIAKYWQLRAGWQNSHWVADPGTQNILRQFSDSTYRRACNTTSMCEQRGRRASAERGGGGERANAQAARRVAQAVAEREEGRRRLNATTVAVSVASVLAAGAVAVILPGTSHAAATGQQLDVERVKFHRQLVRLRRLLERLGQQLVE